MTPNTVMIYSIVVLREQKNKHSHRLLNWYTLEYLRVDRSTCKVIDLWETVLLSSFETF